MLPTLARGLLDLLSPPFCPGCGLDWDANPRGLDFCPACAPLIEAPPRPLQPPADHAAASVFAGPMADAIRRFKYGNERSLAPSLAAPLIAAARAYAGRIDAVVPMPLHFRKLRERGWNPSALLARPVANELGVPLRALLARQRATRDQAGLSRAARATNVLGAFRVRPHPPTRALLIDDVRTTGATLSEAAHTLATHGHRVVTLALAWAPEDPEE